MVSVKSLDGETFFECGECAFKYADIKTAEECEKFCKTHGACNPEITGLAIAK